MKKKTFISIGLILILLILSVTAVYAVGRSRAYKALLADGWTKKEIEAMNLTWSNLLGISMTDFMESQITVNLSGTAFASFHDYEDSYNICALFVQDLVDSGTLKDGDSVWYYPDKIVLSQRTGDKFSKSVKTDVTDSTDENIVSGFNRLYDYIPSVNRILVCKNDIRFVQSEAYDIYEQLVFTSDDSEPDISEDATDYFYHYECLDPLKISKNRYLVSRAPSWLD